MKYEYYRNNKEYNRSFKKGKKIIQDGWLFYANKVTRVRSTWHKQNITYYIKTYIGIFNFFDGDCPRYSIYLGEDAGKMLNRLKKVFQLYQAGGIYKALVNYQYIAQTLNYDNPQIWPECKSIKKYYKRFRSTHGLMAKYNEEEYTLEFSLYDRSTSAAKTEKYVDYLIKHADGLMYDLSRFRIDFSKLKKLKREPSFMTAIGLPRPIQKVIVFGGVLLIKTTVRSVGADLDFDFDIDDSGAEIPDDNFVLDDSEFYYGNSIDTDTSSLDCDFDDGNSFSPYVDYGDSNGYNVSFLGQKETLSSSGGGHNLKVTIEKEPGSSNLFCIKTQHGDVIHNVKGTENYIKIDGIRYNLPKLKG